MTISYPRKKTRQQAQDYRRFQQGSFGGGQNSDTPATKIGQSDMAGLKNSVSYDTYFEGHYGIQLNSDEAAPGSGTKHSLEQNPGSGRWLLHRGSKLWLSVGREQADWTEVTPVGPDGALEATGEFITGVAVSGGMSTYISGLFLNGVTTGQTVYIQAEKGAGEYTIRIFSDVSMTNLIALGSAPDVTSLPTVIVLGEQGGSGVSGSVSLDVDPVTVQNGSGVVESQSVTFDLRGLTQDNTDEYQLWWKVVVAAGDATVTLYKDAALTDSVGVGATSNDATPFAITSENSSGIVGYASQITISIIADGTYSGSMLTFVPEFALIDADSTIAPWNEDAFVVFLRGTAPQNIMVDQHVGEYWFLSTTNGYGSFPIASVGSGDYSYRYLYTYSRIVDPVTGLPFVDPSTANRVNGSLVLEGPSNDRETEETDYATYSVSSPASVVPIELELEIGTDSPSSPPIPAGLNAAAYITHLSIYRTLDVGENSPATNPEQYIWVADVPIYTLEYTDSTADDVLIARLEAGSTAPTPYIYALPSRGWREMDRGIGDIRTDFMFTAFPDASSASYCDVQVIPRLIGYHNGLQRTILQDPVSHLTTTRELMVIVCPSSTYALTTGINQDVGGGLYYIPIITNFERVSGNVGVALRYKLFRVDESSFLAFCTDHTIRVFSAMSWGKPLDGNNVHKITERALNDAKVAFIRGVVFFWFMDGSRSRCLRYGTGGNTGNGWSEIERSAWVYPALVATQETDESLLRLTIMGDVDDVFYAIENEAPDRIYEDESAIEAPILRGDGADQFSDISIDGYAGETYYGEILAGIISLYESEADRTAHLHAVSVSAEVTEPTDDVEFSGSVDGTINVLDITDAEFTIISGIAVGSLVPIASPFTFRELTATVEAFICAHMVSHVYMRFPYGLPAPTVKARWYADGVLADSSTQVPEDGEIQSFRNVKGKRIQLELEPQSSGWQVTGADTEYQTQDIRLVRGPWNSTEAATQKEIATGMISWVNSVSGLLNRADSRRPKRSYIGDTPARTAGPFPGKFGQNFPSEVAFAFSGSMSAFTLMLWAKNPSDAVSVSCAVSAGPLIGFPDANTIDTGIGTYTLPSPCDDGVWHHYAVTFALGTLRVFQDGVEFGSDVLVFGPAPITGFTLGPSNLYDPRTYSVALSSAAIEYYFTHPEQLP